MLAVWEQFKFGKAFLSLVRNPEDTDQVFNLADIGLNKPESIYTKPVIAKAMSDEGFRALYEQHYIGPTIDLNELDKLPDGTLGREFARHMRTNRLAVDFYRPVEPNKPIKYIALRARKLHDLWHVLTGYDTSVRGEIALQGFTFAQLNSGIALSLVAAGILHTMKNHPDGLTALMDGIVEGYTRGRKARYLLGVPWETLWDKPLRDAQRLAGTA